MQILVSDWYFKHKLVFKTNLNVKFRVFKYIYYAY